MLVMKKKYFGVDEILRQKESHPVKVANNIEQLSCFIVGHCPRCSPKANLSSEQSHSHQ
jgi:hypothetical protein